MDYENVLSPEMAHEMAYKMIKNEGQLCFGCGEAITERFILQVNDHTWHVNCLRCCVCQVSLDRQRTCFIKQDSIYCKTDYAREFGTKCTKCTRSISSNDWVRRARDHVFHLACFACDNCKRQLSTGEEFALHDSKVLCKAHYVECVDGGLTDDDCSHKSKAKRIRTTFSDEQVQVLQANFNIDSNPDGQDLERIAQVTGLSKRVTQVWFQNSRARQKKHQQMQNNNNNNLSPGSVITSIKLSPSNWESCSDSQNSDSLPFSD